MKSIFITKFAYFNNDFMKDTSISSSNKNDNSERILNYNFNSYNFNNQKNIILPNTQADNPINKYKTIDEKRDFSLNQSRKKNIINNISTHQKKENYHQNRNKGPFSSYFTGKFNIFNSFNYSKTLDSEIKNSSRRNYQSLNYGEEKKNLNYKLTQEIKFKNNFIQSLKKKKLNKKLMLKLSPINNLSINYDKNKKNFKGKINDKIIENQTIEKTLETQTLENQTLENQTLENLILDNQNELTNSKTKNIKNLKIALYKKLEKFKYSKSHNFENNNISENIDLKKKIVRYQSINLEKNMFSRKKSKNNYLKYKENLLENKIDLILTSKRKLANNFKEIIFLNEIYFQNESKKNKKIKKKIIMKNNNLKKNKLIEYFSKDGYINKIRNLFNEIEKQKFLKKCKILIEKKKNVKKNVLSLKNPYEDISISLHKMKNEFINNNSIYLFTENNKENNNIENPLTLLFGYYITETYFNYADQFINFIYGENEEKKIEKKRESVTILNINNYIFINKFFLFELISKEKHKISKKKTFYKNIRVNKTTKREKKISNLIAFKKETKGEKIKKQIYNFKRISNKLDNFSLLEKKDNLIRYKMKFERSTRISEKRKLFKRKLFKRLSYIICFDNDESFIKLYEKYQDLIDLEETDEKKILYLY